MICFASQSHFSTHTRPFPPFHPTSSLEIQDALDRSIQVQTSIQIRSFHPFKLSTSSLSAFCWYWKVQSIESSFTVWSNLLDVNTRILLQLDTTAPIELTNSGLVRSASNSEQRATGRIQWYPQILLRRTSQDLNRDSSENLTTKSVSDNLVVVQLSMAHLKVWRRLECLYYRHSYVMWITNGAQRGTPNQALVSNSFRDAVKMSHKKCTMSNLVRVLSSTCPYGNYFPSRYCLHHIFTFNKKTYRKYPEFHRNPSLKEVVDFRRSRAFCTSGTSGIWRASHLVRPWTWTTGELGTGGKSRRKHHQTESRNHKISYVILDI